MAGEPHGFSRRVFLVGSAGVLGAATVRLHPALAAALDRGATLTVAGSAAAPAAEPAKPVLTFSVERATDLLLADFTFYGFTVDKTSSPPALVATSISNVDIWVGVVVQLPPQAVGEADYAFPTEPTSDANLPFDPTPVLSDVAGPSRLAFSFEQGARIPLPTMTAADLLDWSGWNLSVQPTAQSGSGSTAVRAPAFNETAIECPYAMFLAPVVDPKVTTLTGFTTSISGPAQPITHRSVTECWGASLSGARHGIFLRGEGAYLPPVAAVWATDFGSGSADATPQTNIIYEEFIPLQIARPPRGVRP